MILPLTPANIAFIAKTGSLQVASAGWQVFGWALVAVTVLAFGAVLVRLVLPWGRAPLIAPAPDSHGCPWCDDRYCRDPDRCDCTAPCGRFYCKAPLSAEELSRG